MKKRVFWILFSAIAVLFAKIESYRGYDATVTPMVNYDLIYLSISSLKQFDKQDQKSTHYNDKSK
jgi:hypothetical protein